MEKDLIKCFIDQLIDDTRMREEDLSRTMDDRSSCKEVVQKYSFVCLIVYQPLWVI